MDIWNEVGIEPSINHEYEGGSKMMSVEGGLS